MKRNLCVFIVFCLFCSLISACGSGAPVTENVASTPKEETRNEEIILDKPITIIDNEITNVKVTRFFREVYNEGTENEFVYAGFEIEAENKTGDTEISLYPRDCSLSDRHILEFAIYGNNDVAAGKIATIKYVRNNQEDFEDLNSLYELEGNMNINGRDSQGSYVDLGGKIAFSIPGALNAESIAEVASDNRDDYANVTAALSNTTWMFNGGGDTILNYITFDENKATLGQIYFDGNREHDNGKNDCNYLINDSSIAVTLADGGELTIPYTMEGEKILLGAGEYFSLEQIEEGLQGYWVCNSYSEFTQCKTVYYLQVDHGTLRSESAAEAFQGQQGDYYYYGPYEDSYTLGIGTFSTNMMHGIDWFYNIIDGKPVILHFDTVCSQADGFPGENGYSF